LAGHVALELERGSLEQILAKIFGETGAGWL
jgi:hypothetical protein